MTLQQVIHPFSGEESAVDLILYEKEKPDVLLPDLFWPEQAFIKYKDRSRGSYISLDTLEKIRKGVR